MFHVLAIVSSLVILTVIMLILNRTNNNKKTLMPRLAGVPMFGCLFQMEYEHMYLMLHRLSLKYGDMFEFVIFGQKFVSLNRSTFIRNVCVHEPNATICAGRPSTFFGKYALDNNSDVAFATVADKNWTLRRKLFSLQLKAYGEGLVRIENEVNKNLGSMKTELNRLKWQSLYPKSMIEEFLLNTVETLVIGRCHGRHGKLQTLLRTIIYDGNKLANLGTNILYSLFPFLRFLPLRHSYLLNEYCKEKQQLMDMLFTIAKDNPEDKGMYQRLIKEIGVSGITEENVRCILLDLIGGAFLTTRGTLLSVIHLLATRPELQKSLQAEIDAVIGRQRQPTLNDRKLYPLIESVLLETLRYTSHVPLSVRQNTFDSCEIKGYHVDKGTIIILNNWTAHHNDKEWNQPYTFLPERFLDESGHLLPATAPVRQKLQKRSCVGEVFARSRMFLFMAGLMQTVTIKACEHMPEFELNNIKPGVVLEPREYKVTFIQRK